jgi:hypothetical protein
MAKVAKKVKKAKIMPAKKKAAPKKKVVMDLEVMVTKLGFGIEKSLSDSHVNYDLTTPGGNYIAGVSFDIQALEYCCGVKEAGGLYIGVGDGDDENDLTKDEKTALEMTIALAFIDVAKNDVSKRYASTSKVTTYRPLIFCSNGCDECVTFESAARKYMKGTFKLVCTSRNPGSLSTIKTYISQL